MKTNLVSIDRSHPDGCQYGLRRGVDYWALVFEGREAIFKHELGALYVAHLLLDPPSEPALRDLFASVAQQVRGWLGGVRPEG